MAGVRLPIVTMALQAFVTEPYKHVLDGLLSSMDLYVYVSQTARGELLVGAEVLPYNTYSTRSTFGFLAEAAKRIDPDLSVDGESACDAPVDGSVRHVAGFLAAARRIGRVGVLPDVGHGHVGIQGLADLRPD